MKGKIIALFKQVPPFVYIVAGVLTLAGGWLALDRAKQRQIGALNAQIAAQEQTNADLRRAQDSLAKAYRTDTLRLTKIRRVTDSLTVTVDQWKHDTVKVVEYVVKADSTIKVCSLALQTCEQRVSVAQRGWDGARDEIKLLKASISPAKKWLWAGVGVGAGYIAGRLTGGRE